MDLSGEHSTSENPDMSVADVPAGDGNPTGGNPTGGDDARDAGNATTDSMTVDNATTDEAAAGSPTADAGGATAGAGNATAGSGNPIPGGLRERKKRETREKISDLATELFIARGYDEVKISEIAEAAGVSEKTVYNYFPTKESLVFDHAEEQRMLLVKAVREREQGTSAVVAFTRALKAMTAEMFADITEESASTVIAFGEMVRSTPALRAAAGEHRHLLVDDLTQILSANFRIDPREAEIVTAARAIVSLLELSFDSDFRHVEDGLVGDELRVAVEADIERGARLVATGLLSLQVLVDERRAGSHERGYDFDPDQVREQVMSALRDAKAAWREFSEDAIAAGREVQAEAMSAQNGDYSYVRELARQRAQELKQRARQIGEAQRRAAHDAQREAREIARAQREAERTRREAERELRRRH